jgi:hypothetical protein
MVLEEITVIFGLLFLVVGGLLMARRISRGRELCDEFARRLPTEYRDHKRPRPAFFYNARSAAYSAFVLQCKFRQLPDPDLVAQFEAVRMQEIKTLTFAFFGFAALGLAYVWIEIFGRG